MNDEYVIQCVSLADGRTNSVTGAYLMRYDPDHGPYGEVLWTLRKQEALKFPNQVAAWECWRQVNGTYPLRPDGKPNRPLTMYTVTIAHVDDV